MITLSVSPSCFCLLRSGELGLQMRATMPSLSMVKTDPRLT